MTKEQAKDQLIDLLYSQVVDLSLMSKIELGDDVIQEIKRLKSIIHTPVSDTPIDWESIQFPKVKNMTGPIADKIISVQPKEKP